MRITDQMTNRMAEKSGLPIHSNKGLNSSDNSLLSALNKKSSTTAYDKMKTKSNFQTLTKDANSLHDTANQFTTEEGKDSIYSKAVESQDMSEIISGAQKLADGYNKILSGLKESSFFLNGLPQMPWRKRPVFPVIMISPVIYIPDQAVGMSFGVNIDCLTRNGVKY